MTSLANFNPFLHNTMSLAVNPTTSSATTQDGRGTGGNSESIPGGEPVHCSIIVLPTLRILMSFYFQIPAQSTLLPEAMDVEVPSALPGTKPPDSRVN